MEPGVSCYNVSVSFPLLSVSVVSHGSAGQVSTLLDSLAAHEDRSRIQLILTANLGDDLPDVDPAPWASLTILRNERPRGFASNHNAAFLHAQHEFLCLLNPDVIFLEPVFEKLTGRIRAGEADIIAPLAVNEQGEVQDSFRSLPTPGELIRRRTIGSRAPAAFRGADLISPDWLAGFFLLLPSRLYADLGGMDERYRLYLEDVDFCTRARLKGCAIRLDPTVRFQHDGRRASRDDPRFLIWHLSSAARFFTSPVYRQARKRSQP